MFETFSIYRSIFGCLILWCHHQYRKSHKQRLILTDKNTLFLLLSNFSGHASSPLINLYIPFYMLGRFFSGHTRTKVLVRWLVSSDHSSAVSLYERVRPEHHLQHPYLHQQRGLKRSRCGNARLKRGRGQRGAIYRLDQSRCKTKEAQLKSQTKEETKRATAARKFSSSIWRHKQNAILFVPKRETKRKIQEYSPNVWRFWMDIRHSNYLRTKKISVTRTSTCISRWLRIWK